MRDISHFVNGQSVAGRSGRYADVYDPALGIVTARVPLASAEEIDAAVAAAKAAFRSWAETPPARRAAVMFKFRELLLRELDSKAPFGGSILQKLSFHSGLYIIAVPVAHR